MWGHNKEYATNQDYLNDIEDIYMEHEYEKISPDNKDYNKLCELLKLIKDDGPRTKQNGYVKIHKFGYTIFGKCDIDVKYYLNDKSIELNVSGYYN